MLLQLRASGASDLSDPDLVEYEDYCEGMKVNMADGTGVYSTQLLYGVEVHYQVPGAEDGAVDIWYQAVAATSPELARRIAENEFRLLESLDASGWERTIVGIEVFED
jgi:hypothetical protein